MTLMYLNEGNPVNFYQEEFQKSQKFNINSLNIYVCVAQCSNTRAIKRSSYVILCNYVIM